MPVIAPLASSITVQSSSASLHLYVPIRAVVGARGFEGLDSRIIAVGAIRCALAKVSTAPVPAAKSAALTELDIRAYPSFRP